MNKDQDFKGPIKRNRLIRELCPIFTDFLTATKRTKDVDFPVDPAEIEKGIPARIKTFEYVITLLEKEL